MKKQMTKTLFVVLAITSMFLVGCGGKETVTDTSTETGTETIVAEVETSTQEENESQEVIAETEAPTPTEEPTPEPTEEPTPEPTEEPTPTPEPVHEHSYAETILQQATCSTAGTKLYTCSCGHSYEEQYYGECVSDGNRVVTHEPTCNSEGANGEHCIYCGVRMYARSIPKTEHTPNNYWSCYTPTGDYYLNCSICSHVITHTTTRPEGVEIREYSDVDSSTLQPIN